MKQIALVAALAALAAPAFAQSTVTLWGRINTTVESQKVGAADRTVAVNNNASRLGFKGVEDLGGGLKASFFLEHGLDSDTGTVSNGGEFWGRAAYVELGSTAMGSVRLGRWFPGSYYATADYVSMHNNDTGSSSDALFSFQGFGNASKNKVAYFTPDFGGFTAEVSVHAGEGGDKRSVDVSGNYDQGPLHLGAGYTQQGEAQQFAIRGLYALGAFTFGAYYEREDAGSLVATRATRDIGRLAVMYTMGASEFHLNVGGTKAGGLVTSGFRNNGAKQYTLGYNYNLSKRTKLYGYYTAIDSTAANKVGDFSSLAAGIRHNF